MFYEVIFDENLMEYSINPQITGNVLVPPNKTKSTTNDKHCKRSNFIKLLLQKQFLRDH